VADPDLGGDSIGNLFGLAARQCLRAPAAHEKEDIAFPHALITQPCGCQLDQARFAPESAAQADLDAKAGRGAGCGRGDVVLAVQPVEEDQWLGRDERPIAQGRESLVETREPGRRELEDAEVHVAAHALPDQSAELAELSVGGRVRAAVAEEESGGVHSATPAHASSPPISGADRDTTSPTTRIEGGPSPVSAAHSAMSAKEPVT
jgi:hypothetical protein